MRATIKTADAYVKLVTTKQDLEAKLDGVKIKIATMEASLIEYFQDHGLQNITKGKSTVYLQRSLYASLTDKDAGYAKLREHGHGELVKDNINGNTFSAWVRERIADYEKANPDEISTDDLNKKLDLPNDLQNLIRVSDKYSVRVRKGK
ncbi:hypothetical protein LCGC14_0320260 [marine sediment metagenome]|uniref:Uncharacterized protein n=1 Tax=marine sediment metagenome TaxID=412755 RepID=A0A0F9WRN1_9ZZZZ